MRKIISAFNAATSLVLLIILVLIFMYLTYLTFNRYSLDARVFEVVIAGSYPIACLYEQFVVRLVDNRSRKQEFYFNIVSDHESKAHDEEFSLITSVLIGFVSSFIVFIRILIPDKVDLTSTVIAGVLIWFSYYEIKKRKLERIRLENIERRMREEDEELTE